MRRCAITVGVDLVEKRSMLEPRLHLSRYDRTWRDKLHSGPARASTCSLQYLFIWAGPHGSHGGPRVKSPSGGASNFLGVIDADPSSGTYGKVLASVATGVPGSMAHHTELVFSPGFSLFANDFYTGHIFLFDVSNPRKPRLAARIDSVPGFRKPHGFARLSNGNVIATLQFGDGSVAGDPGGIVEFDPAGKLLRTSSAADPTFPGARIRPNGIELIPDLDRAVTTSMPMDDERTADVVQVWRLSDLRLLRTIRSPLCRPTPPTDSRMTCGSSGMAARGF